MVRAGNIKSRLRDRSFHRVLSVLFSSLPSPPFSFLSLSGQTAGYLCDARLSAEVGRCYIFGESGLRKFRVRLLSNNVAISLSRVSSVREGHREGNVEYQRAEERRPYTTRLEISRALRAEEGCDAG